MVRLPRLCAILDPAQIGDRSPVAVAKALLAAGVKWVQYRDKLASSRQLLDNSRTLRLCLRPAGARLIVNDRADVAWLAEADGVHVGQEDLLADLARRVLAAGMLIGCSTHTLAQVVEAERSSADYVAFGPIFPTESKERAGPVVGVEGLAEARRRTRKPLVAIGGITLENAGSVIRAGADAVAVIRGLLAAPDVEARARDFLRVLT